MQAKDKIGGYKEEQLLEQGVGVPLRKKKGDPGRSHQVGVVGHHRHLEVQFREDLARHEILQQPVCGRLRERDTLEEEKDEVEQAASRDGDQYRHEDEESSSELSSGPKRHGSPPPPHPTGRLPLR